MSVHCMEKSEHLPLTFKQEKSLTGLNDMKIPISQFHILATHIDSQISKVDFSNASLYNNNNNNVML